MMCFANTVKVRLAREVGIRKNQFDLYKSDIKTELINNINL